MKSNLKNYKSITVFQSPLLEKYSHVHPATPFLVFSPVAVYLSVESLHVNQLALSTFATLVFVGILAWTFMEYVLHRHLFHLKDRGPVSRKSQFIMHGFHHIDANDPTRLVMTPIVSITLAILFYVAFKAALGFLWAQPFMVGFLIGYLSYDYIHYYVHFFTPTTRIGKYLKTHHMKHHYVGAESRWGVSSPLWDYIFGTLEESDMRIPENPQEAIGSR